MFLLPSFLRSKKSRVMLVKRSDYEAIVNRASVLERIIQKATAMIGNIESGNLINDGNPSDNNELILSLISMSNRMREIAVLEQRRSWTAEGLARFVDILRSRNDNLKNLGNIIINSLVKYMNANQGSLYFLDETSGDPTLELIGCFAYDRKKFLNQRIAVGQGLAGQCVLEKDIIYLTNLPPDYINITSGLGNALPRNLLIVPLLLDDKVYGIIELASFTIFEDYQREFVKKIGESIASTISGVKANQHTRKLIEEMQSQAEFLRAQEEMMRQNLEELTATQEEMSRIVNEAQEKDGYLRQLLDTYSYQLFTIDRNRTLANWNRCFEETLADLNIRVTKGTPLKDLVPRESFDDVTDQLREAFAGKEGKFKIIFFSRARGVLCEAHFCAVRDTRGEIIEVVISINDSTGSLADPIDRTDHPIISLFPNPTTQPQIK